jgi:hypothetical protein
MLEKFFFGVKRNKRGIMDQRNQCIPEKKENQRDKGKMKKRAKKRRKISVRNGWIEDQPCRRKLESGKVEST